MRKLGIKINKNVVNFTFVLYGFCSSFTTRKSFCAVLVNLAGGKSV